MQNMHNMQNMPQYAYHTTDFIFSVNFTHFFSNRMYIFSSVRKFSVTSYWFWTVTGACRHDHICSVMFWRITAVARLKHGRRTADAHVPSNMSLFSLRLGPARVDETRVYKLILLCFASPYRTVLCFSCLHHQVT